MDSVHKFFLIAAGLIVTGMLVFLGFRMSDVGEDVGGHMVNRLTELEQSLKDADVMQYDGVTVTGSDVVNFIRKSLSEHSTESTAPYQVIVVTGTVTTHKDNTTIGNILNFSHISYVNPTAKFVGEVNRNTNGVIVSVTFTQK